MKRADEKKKRNELDLLDEVIAVQNALGELRSATDVLQKSFANPRQTQKRTHSLSPEQQLKELLTIAATYTSCYITTSQLAASYPNVYVLETFLELDPYVLAALLLETNNIAIFDSFSEASELNEEGAFSDAVSCAEQVAKKHIRLVTHEDELVSEKRKEIERIKFINNLNVAADTFLQPPSKRKAPKSPVAEYVETYMEELKMYKLMFYEAFGRTNEGGKRYILDEGVAVLGHALSRAHTRKQPVGPYELFRVEICEKRCLLCEPCIDACPHNVLAVSSDDRLSAREAFCTGCGICINACTKNALSLKACDATKELVLFLPKPQRKRDALQKESELVLLQRARKE